MVEKLDARHEYQFSNEWNSKVKRWSDRWNKKEKIEKQEENGV